jgi:hypothetical protein
MVIAVYVDLETYQSSDADLYFIKNLLDNLVTTFPQDHFYLILPNPNDEPDQQLPLSKIYLNINTGFLKKYRIYKKLSKVIAEIKADLLFSIDVELKINISQALLLTGLKGNKKIQPVKLKSLKSIFVLSEAAKTELLNKNEIDQNKLSVIYGGSSKIFQPVYHEIKTFIKEKYAEGKEYFIYRGLIKQQNNIIPLLKAFSLFKKRQKSSMKLVLLGRIAWENNDFDKIINTYKYREDLKVINNATKAEEPEILAAAYALIQPYISNNLLFLFDAMQCHVPVVIENNPAFKKITSDTVLYFDSKNEMDIAYKMKIIYKDETLRSGLIEKSKNLIEDYNWEKTTGAIVKTFNN